MKKIFILFFLLLSGCTTTLDYDTQKFYVSPNIKLHRLEAKHYTREKDGLILLNITGESSVNQVVFYKVEWFNNLGMPIKSIMSTWNTVSIVKNIPFNWNAVSPTPKAVSYKVIITSNIGNGILK